MKKEIFFTLVKLYDQADKLTDSLKISGVTCDFIDNIPDTIIELMSKEFEVEPDIIAEFLMPNSVFSGRKERFPYICEFYNINVSSMEEAYHAFCSC